MFWVKFKTSKSMLQVYNNLVKVIDQKLCDWLIAPFNIGSI